MTGLRSQETQRLLQVQAVIKAADQVGALLSQLYKSQPCLLFPVRFEYQIEDLLSAYPPFTTYTADALLISIEFHWRRGLDQATLDWMLALTQRNMEAIYEKAWGWSTPAKAEELGHEKSRFLIAQPQEGQANAAFVHFRCCFERLCSILKQYTANTKLWPRFEEEGGSPVLYVYDIQMEAIVQRKGLGRHLMRLLELVARRLAYLLKFFCIFPFLFAKICSQDYTAIMCRQCICFVFIVSDVST